MGANLLPSFDSDAWIPFKPDDTFAAKLYKTGENGAAALAVGLQDSGEDMGRWSCEIEGIKAGGSYNFHIEYTMQNVLYEHETVQILISWKNMNGEFTLREYAYNTNKRQDGMTIADKRLTAPADAAGFRLDLIVLYAKNAVVSFYNASLVITNQHPRRTVKIAATFIKKFQGPEYNLPAALELTDKAAAEGADVVIFAEMFMYFGGSYKKPEIAESVPGKTTEIFAKKAVQHGIYIIINIYENDNGRIYNTSVVIGRDGRIVHKYRKTHIPLGEVDTGVRPGDTINVFDLDFGRCGILICWDHYFPEAVRMLAMQGAEILFVSSIGYTEHARTYAMNNGVYMAIAGINGPCPSRIISPGGELLAHAGSTNEDGYAIAEIDLDKRFPEPYMILGKAGGDTRHVNLQSMRPSLYKY